MQERLIQEFPYLLLENCSGGGARFDPCMLYYSPQIWCSDDTDAIERLRIQEGTALIYPLSSMGAHVRPNVHSHKIKMQGFLPEETYRLEETGELYTGEQLMQMGFLVKGMYGDFISRLYHFVMEE